MVYYVLNNKLSSFYFKRMSKLHVVFEKIKNKDTSFVFPKFFIDFKFNLDSFICNCSHKEKVFKLLGTNLTHESFCISVKLSDLKTKFLNSGISSTEYLKTKLEMLNDYDKENNTKLVNERCNCSLKVIVDKMINLNHDFHCKSLHYFELQYFPQDLRFISNLNFLKANSEKQTEFLVKCSKPNLTIEELKFVFTSIKKELKKLI